MQQTKAKYCARRWNTCQVALTRLILFLFPSGTHGWKHLRILIHRFRELVLVPTLAAQAWYHISGLYVFISLSYLWCILVESMNQFLWDRNSHYSLRVAWGDGATVWPKTSAWLPVLAKMWEAGCGSTAYLQLKISMKNRKCRRGFPAPNLETNEEENHHDSGWIQKKTEITEYQRVTSTQDYGSKSDISTDNSLAQFQWIVLCYVGMHAALEKTHGLNRPLGPKCFLLRLCRL